MSSSRYNSSYRPSNIAELGDEKRLSIEKSNFVESSRDRDYYRSSRDSRERSLSRERGDLDSYRSSSSRYSSSGRERERDREGYRRDDRYSSSRRSRSRSPRRSPRDRKSAYSPVRSYKDIPPRESRPISHEPPVARSYSGYSRPVSSSFAPEIPPPRITLPTYPSIVPSRPATYYPSHPHPPAPPVMPWREPSAPAPHYSSYNYPSAQAAPYSSAYSHNDTRMPQNSGYAPYSAPSGRSDGFDSFTNLHRQDWSSFNLIPFEKNFYREHPAVRARSESEIKAYREKYAMSVFGSNIPKPVENFEEGCFPEYISKMLSGQGFAHPTAIQAQVSKIFTFMQSFTNLFFLGMAYGNVWS